MEKFFDDWRKEVKDNKSGISYFKDNIDFVKLSTYLSNLETRDRKDDVKHIIGVIGDVILPENIIHSFIMLYHSFNGINGLYNVMEDDDTLKGLYQIYLKYPNLSGNAISKIADYYIKDLFEEYALVDVLGKIIKVFGENTEAFLAFMGYVKEKAEILQRYYVKESGFLNRLMDDYGNSKIKFNYIDYLKKVMLKEHIHIESIISSIPSPDLIKKDEEFLLCFSKKSGELGIYGDPISYAMTRSLAKYCDLSRFKDYPTYYIERFYMKVDSPFSKQDFLDSVQEEKGKVFKKIKE